MRPASLDRIKNVARKLKNAIREHGCEISHGQCIEAITAGLGYLSWKDLLDSHVPPSWDRWKTADAVVRLKDFADYSIDDRDPLPKDLAAIVDGVLP